MKKIRILISVVVSSLVLLSVVLGSAKWITKKASTKVVDNEASVEPVLDEKGDILGSNDIHPLPKQMLFSTPSAESDAITVSANFTPIDANVIKLNWNIAFKNAESEWAQGKNASDYILIEANNITCKVSCLQEFGEPIQLICSSRYDPTINASCTLNYGKRIVDRTLAFTEQKYCQFDATKEAYYISFTNDRTLQFAKSNEQNSTYGLGTAALNVEEKYYLKTEDSFIEFINGIGEIIAIPSKSKPMITPIKALDMNMEKLLSLMGADPGNPETHDLFFYDLLPDYIYSHPHTPLFKIVLEVWHNGNLTKSFEYSICASKWDYGISVQSISLDPISICL